MRSANDKPFSAWSQLCLRRLCVVCESADLAGKDSVEIWLDAGDCTSRSKENHHPVRWSD